MSSSQTGPSRAAIAEATDLVGPAVDALNRRPGITFALDRLIDPSSGGLIIDSPELQRLVSTIRSLTPQDTLSLLYRNTAEVLARTIAPEGRTPASEALDPTGWTSGWKPPSTYFDHLQHHGGTTFDRAVVAGDVGSDPIVLWRTYGATEALDRSRSLTFLAAPLAFDPFERPLRHEAVLAPSSTSPEAVWLLDWNPIRQAQRLGADELQEFGEGAQQVAPSLDSFLSTTLQPVRW